MHVTTGSWVIVGPALIAGACGKTVSDGSDESPLAGAGPIERGGSGGTGGSAGIGGIGGTSGIGGIGGTSGIGGSGGSAPGCDDGVTDGLETDVDCGGPSCPPCGINDRCLTETDCESMLQCLAGRCTPCSCSDGATCGDETDVDCGGPLCPACGPGSRCETSIDCLDRNCSAGVCASPACNDGIKNGDETDVDCGGSCLPCL